MVLVGSAPGTRIPRMGPGNTDKTKFFHLFPAPLLFFSTCSADDSQVRPTKPDLANLRFPTPIALSEKERVS